MAVACILKGCTLSAPIYQRPCVKQITLQKISQRFTPELFPTGGGRPPGNAEVDTKPLSWVQRTP